MVTDCSMLLILDIRQERFGGIEVPSTSGMVVCLGLDMLSVIVCNVAYLATWPPRTEPMISFIVNDPKRWKSHLTIKSRLDHQCESPTFHSI